MKNEVINVDTFQGKNALRIHAVENKQWGQ
jgi:hypothetical protein